MSDDYKTGLIKQRHEKNPFVTDGVFSVPTRRQRGQQIVTAQGPATLRIGEEDFEAAQIVSVREVDTEIFVKFFVGQIRTFFDLSPSAIKMLLILLKIVGQVQYKNSDRIVLTEAIAREIALANGQKPFSKTSYFRSVNELISFGFLAATTTPPFYFINPALVFNGDRVRFITELRKKDASAEDDAGDVIDDDRPKGKTRRIEVEK